MFTVDIPARFIMLLDRVLFLNLLIVLIIAAVSEGKKKSKPKCGKRSRSLGRIVGGHDAGLWPWQVEILKLDPTGSQYEHKCGGTLIDRQWVMTTAGCVFEDPYPTFYKVKIGEYDRSKPEKGEQEIYAESLVINRDFLAEDHRGNDIALIKLNRKVKLGRTAQLVCLPDAMSRVEPGKKCFMTGWGRVSSAGAMANVLQQAELPIVSDDKCKAKNDPVSQVDRWTMLCAGYDNKKRSGCKGDSGGPLVCKENGRWVLRGLVSWGDIKCNGRQMYSVFTRVSHFMHWVYFSMLIPQRPYPRCQDNHWYCGHWHAKGLCTNSFYKNSLRKYCPETCGHCKE